MNASPHQPFDFDNMPLTPEQDILATLKRIEVLLTPKMSASEAAYHAANAAKMEGRQPAETAKVPAKPSFLGKGKK